MLAVLVALATGATLGPAWGQVPPAGVAPPKAPPAPSVGTPAAVPIPVPEVARRAEEVGKLLRDLEALLLPGPAIEAIETRSPDIAAQIEERAAATARLLEGQPAAPTLDGLTAQWQVTRAELIGYVTILTGRATAIEKALERLTAERETWTRTRVEARASRAPAPVIERIDAVLAALAAARAPLQAQRAAVLVLQDRVAQDLARCEVALARLASLRRDIAGRLLHRDSLPLWETGQRVSALTELPDRVRHAVADDVAQLRQLVQGQPGKILGQVVLFLGLVLLMGAAWRGASRWAGADEATAASVRVFRRPVSAALVFTILVAGWVYLPAPARAVVSLGQFLALVPALRLARLAVDPRLKRFLYVLGAFFLADLVRRLASVVPLLEQQIFLLEMLAAMATLTLWLAATRRRGQADTLTGQARALRLAAQVALPIFAAAFAAGAAGYMNLALLLGAGVLGNGYLALVLYAGLRVADALVVFALRVRPLNGLGMVRRHRLLLERRAHGVLRALAIAGWAVFAMQYFDLWWAAVALGEAVLGARLERGSISVSLADVLAFAITAAAALFLSRFLRFTLEEDVYPRLQLGRGVAHALSRLLQYAFLLVGFLLALAVLGVDLTKVTILAGAFGVGIAFGLQTIVNNFVSGLLLLFERRIDVGDAVQIGDVAGQVQQLGARATTVRTWEGAEVIVPNASLIADRVTNWTLSDRQRRIDVGVGVAYGTPPEKMLEILLGVARAHPRVLPDPEPVALFLEFGDSALRFELRVWTGRFDLWVQTRSELSVALYTALGKAGVEIPFPQREVHVRRDPDGGAPHGGVAATDRVMGPTSHGPEPIPSHKTV
jgi:small-conductance mechanosensitive channel